MCGIYGSTISYPFEVLQEKLARISFRGPDYSGIHYTKDFIFGHNRLAIIDLDYRSNQPFVYAHLSIVFNGEIYNYQELRKGLSSLGYQFETSSDTEVICAAYMAYGSKCVEHFNGMFAFVIYDGRLRNIFGARDRFGKKPLYYCHDDKEFEFASQPSQIQIGRRLNVDEVAVSEYYIWGYMPEPRSVWKEVKKLPPGHRFTFDPHTGRLEIEKYWDLNSSQQKFNGSYKDAVDQLEALISDAVKIRLFADVPLGVFLSGGVDSSLVAAIASQNTPTLNTFSIKFEESAFDESVYAEQVARHLATRHTTIVCNYNEGIELIRNFGRYYDEPFADPSAIPSLLLSRHTRQHVTVALSGDGGDEGFIGYDRYRRLRAVSPLFRLPLSVRKIIASLTNLSPHYTHKLIALGLTQQDLQTLYAKMFGGIDFSWTKNSDTSIKTPFDHLLSHSQGALVERLADFDLKTYLNDDINTKVDRASMAFSLESRSPLMDYRVIEFARSLPLEYRYRNGVQKRVLKDILYRHVPAAYFNRPKAGFSMPFKEWFRYELKEYVLDSLSDNELKNIPGINVDRSKEIIREHMSGKWNRYQHIWKLLVMSQWIKNNKEPVPVLS